MKTKLKNIILAAILPFCILLLWQLFYSFEVIPHWILKSPCQVLITLWHLLIDGTLLHLVSISASNALIAFTLALVVSVAFGLLLGINPTAEKIFFPTLTLLYPIPSLAWLPIIVIFLGFTRQTIWIVVFLSAFFKIVFNVIAGVKSVNKSLLWAASNFEIRGWKLIQKVILPGAFPHILTGIRLGFGSSWRSLIGAEMLAVGVGGLGNFIWTSQWFMKFDQAIAGIMVIALIGFAIEKLFFHKIEILTVKRWGLMRE